MNKITRMICNKILFLFLKKYLNIPNSYNNDTQINLEYKNIILK